MPENKPPEVGQEVNFIGEDGEWQSSTITEVHDQSEDSGTWVVGTDDGDTLHIKWNVEDECWDEVGE